MLVEPSFCRHLQWCTHDCLLPRCGPVGGKSRACAGGRKENNQRNQIPSFPSSRHVPFGRLYEDDNSDSDTDRTTGLAAALSNTTSASATLTYEKSLEPQGPIVSSGTGKQTDKFVTDWLAMDSTSMDQMKDEDLWHFRHGPLPGDLAEVEAFCRIFRIAEQVHKAVMDALRSVSDAREDHSDSFDNNGSSIVDPDPESLEVQDVPLLEEKVVSSLGCIGALLHQEKQEVLSGRLSVGFTPMARHDSMPPLALFRVEMKRCCEELEALLLCYFPTEDGQFQPMHKKFQKLRNICLDAGYPRAEGSPNHADIPNWGPVRSKELWNKRESETDGETVFWRGGQVTDDGLQWLIDKGFKVIVDMRAEDIRDYLAKTAVSAAVSSGKLKRVSLPIDPGSNPTKDQVMEFAKLVADANNRPLYLHSQKGVGRTSAMVSRWREIGSLSSSMEVLTQSDLTNSPRAADKKLGGSSSQSESFLKDESDPMPSIATQDSPNAASTETSSEVGTTLRSVFVVGCTPFDAQRPPARNCFSRQEMSNFFRGRQVSPSTFRWKRSSKAVVDAAIQLETKDSSTETINELAGRWYVNTPGIPRAGKRDNDNDVAVESAKSGLLDSYGHGDGDLNVVNCQEEPILKASFMGSSQSTTPSNGAHSKVSGNIGNVMGDSEDVTVVGDMCASTTGVVRLQSRKKAEMYLVRTDGFTCTREKVKESTLAFTHPSTQQQMLMWKTAPKTVLLLKKLGGELMEEAQQVASFLHYKEGMNVIVEPDVHDHFARVPGFGFIQTFQNHDISNLHERVDFVVCLGGDGVILHASNLFRSAVPPVVSFNLGSLGFLTAHPFEDFMQDLRAIIHGNTIVEGVYITLRMRLHCELFRNGKSVPGKVFDVLNEVVVDRGSNPYLCKIECYERKRLITKVQADGVIIATPTGSTAYSTAAGGSMVHPNVPCMLFTPICPHSLSFRPVILPDSAILELKVPEDARSNAWVSFDGKRRQQMSRGDSVCICMSQHPLPTVNKSDQTDDWFQSLVRCLNWNERLEQKALPKIL